MIEEKQKEYKEHALKVQKLLENQENNQESVVEQSDSVFILSKRWLSEWKRFINYDSITESDYLEKYPILNNRPGIINEDILLKVVNPIKLPSKEFGYCNQYLKSDVILNDILFVTKELWDLFSSEYLGEEIERPVVRLQYGSTIPYVDIELQKLTIVFISKSFCNWIENNKVHRLKLNFVQFNPLRRLSDLKREIAFSLATLETNPIALNPFTNYPDFPLKLRSPTESVNLRMFRLNARTPIDNVLESFRLQCKADGNGNYSVNFPGSYLEKGIAPKLQDLGLKEEDIIFIEVHEKESTWILKTQDLNFASNDRSRDEMMIEEEKIERSRNATYTCSICRDQCGEEDSLVNGRCRHRYCVNCVQAMLLEDTQSRNCAVAGCSMPIGNQEINSFLDYHVHKLSKIEKESDKIDDDNDDETSDSLPLPDRVPNFGYNQQNQNRGQRGSNPSRGGRGGSPRGNNRGRISSNPNRTGSNTGRGTHSSTGRGSNSNTGTGSNTQSQGANQSNRRTTRSNTNPSNHPPPTQRVTSHFANINPLFGNLSFEDIVEESQPNANTSPRNESPRLVSKKPSNESKDSSKKSAGGNVAEGHDELSKIENLTLTEPPTGYSTNDCIICMSAKKNAIFIPCGHMSCCLDCAKNCKKICPICRKKGKVNQVYIS